jgi:hypothetical protein
VSPLPGHHVEIDISSTFQPEACCCGSGVNRANDWCAQQFGTFCKNQRTFCGYAHCMSGGYGHCDGTQCEHLEHPEAVCAPPGPPEHPFLPYADLDVSEPEKNWCCALGGLNNRCLYPSPPPGANAAAECRRLRIIDRKGSTAGWFPVSSNSPSPPPLTTASNSPPPAPPAQRLGCLTDAECRVCTSNGGSYCKNYQAAPHVCQGDGAARYFPSCLFTAQVQAQMQSHNFGTVVIACPSEEWREIGDCACAADPGFPYTDQRVVDGKCQYLASVFTQTGVDDFNDDDDSDSDTNGLSVGIVILIAVVSTLGVVLFGIVTWLRFKQGRCMNNGGSGSERGAPLEMMAPRV